MKASGTQQDKIIIRKQLELTENMHLKKQQNIVIDNYESLNILQQRHKPLY